MFYKYCLNIATTKKNAVVASKTIKLRNLISEVDIHYLISS